MNRHLVLLVIFTINFILCLKAQTPNTPNSFHFSISTESQGYNSESQQFWRLYTSGKRYFDIELSPAQLEKIRNIIPREEMEALPDRFTPKGMERIEQTPCFHSKMEASWGGVRKSVEYNNCEYNSEMESEAEPFLRWYSKIWNILHELAEFEKVPESDVFWE